MSCQEWWPESHRSWPPHSKFPVLVSSVPSSSVSLIRCSSVCPANFLFLPPALTTYTTPCCSTQLRTSPISLPPIPKKHTQIPAREHKHTHTHTPELNPPPLLFLLLYLLHSIEQWSLATTLSLLACQSNNKASTSNKQTIPSIMAYETQTYHAPKTKSPLFSHPAAAAPIPKTTKNTTRPQEDIIIVTQSKPFSEVPFPRPPQKKQRETETEMKRNNKKDRQSVRGRKKTQKQRKKHRSSRCTAIPKKASKARRCLSLRGIRETCNDRRRRKRRRRSRWRKTTFLGFGFTFVFFFWSLSSKEKHTQESGVSTYKQPFFYWRNFFKKWNSKFGKEVVFEVFSRQKRGRGKKKKKRCKNRHIHVICFHSAAKIYRRII